LPDVASSFDAIVTDPPYGIDFTYDVHDDGDEEAYMELLEALQPYPIALLQYPEEMMRLVVPMLGPPDECLAWVYPSNLRRQFRLWGIWGLKVDFNAVKQPARNPNDARIQAYYDGPAMVASYDWWEQPQVKNVSAEKTAHPCQIPVSSVERVMRLCQVKAPCDPFLGSGTSGVAAARLGLPFVGIEKSPAYFDIACRRIEEAQKQGDLFIEPAA
jgi:DNA modification methylase